MEPSYRDSPANSCVIFISILLFRAARVVLFVESRARRRGSSVCIAKLGIYCRVLVRRFDELRIFTFSFGLRFLITAGSCFSGFSSFFIQIYCYFCAHYLYSDACIIIY